MIDDQEIVISRILKTGEMTKVGWEVAFPVGHPGCC